jgi:uncharacterized membrane protein
LPDTYRCTRGVQKRKYPPGNLFNKNTPSLLMKYKTILLLISLALISSIILTFVPIEQACGLETSGCYQVQTSQYEEIMGMKTAHLGLVAFSILFIITFLHSKKPTKQTKKLIQTGLILGSLMAIYFLYLQFFVLKAICKYCMVTDLGVLLALVIMFFMKD